MRYKADMSFEDVFRLLSFSAWHAMLNFGKPWWWDRFEPIEDES